MDYFFYKDVLVGFLLIAYILYVLIIFSKRYKFKKKSTHIIKIPVARNTIQYILLIILTYIVTIPISTYYFGKGLRLLYCQFVVTEDYYLRRQGFFLDDYDSEIIAWVVLFYFFLIIKLIFSFITRNYTIRKDNFILISWFVLLSVFNSIGMGHDIRTYTHEVLTVFFMVIMYFVVRNKVNNDSLK